MRENYLVFSDLDGTLLDHYDYSWHAAATEVNALLNADIPLILNTSKTKVELDEIRQALSLRHPFIIENGAAVYIPIGYFAKQPIDTFEQGGYWIKSFCQPRKYWLALLAEHSTEFQPYFQGFSQLSIKQLSTLTGLNEYQASLAKTRQYSEPLHWIGNEVQRDEFVDFMSNLGANVLQGGRFLHVSGECDKGQAQLWLAERYREHYQDNEVLILALGDSDNDVAMLEAASVAIQVKSPKHKFPQLTRQAKAYQTHATGPAGWAEAIRLFIPSLATSEVHYG